LCAFTEDNLLKRNGNITHHGEDPEEDEDLSPSLENFIVLTWLRLIHKDLPRMVKQRYGTELRSQTLASIKPEISQALTSLLDEVRTSEEVRVMRSAATRDSRQTFPRQRFKSTSVTRTPPQKMCPLCQQSGRGNTNHYLSQCTYLPIADRKYMVKARQIADILDEEVDLETDDPVTTPHPPVPDTQSCSSTLRVQVRQSPHMTAFYGHQVANITIDSGATGNMIRLSSAKALGVNIQRSTQSARQADGMSPLSVAGETRFSVTREDHRFYFEGLVVENLDVDILAGIPFMEENDITIRPAKQQIILGNGTIYSYGCASTDDSSHSVRRIHLLRAPAKKSIIWPGEFLEIRLPEPLTDTDSDLAIEPHCADQDKSSWPSPSLITSVAGLIRIPNLTDQPQSVKRHEHFCQVLPVTSETSDEEDPTTGPSITIQKTSLPQFSDRINLDPDNVLPTELKNKFQTLHYSYDDVFSPNIGGYNGSSGPFKASIHMGPVQPPQRKGRVTQYAKNRLIELQEKFNELEAQGVFARPEDIGVEVEYLNPSFLVKKSNGGSRLVTAFAEVGRYSKPQPSLMPNVDAIMRQISSWKYIITTDLTMAFYQIPLSKQSMKYCGVATPFRGVRVYRRCAMGMPGSETALEELMCRVLGDLVQEGIVTKLADDLYCGANDLDDLYSNWARILQALDRNNLKLSPGKTVIAPSTVTILGWVWHNGTIKASPHRISTLSTCPPPTTVTGLRSFIGAYKVLARVLPNCSSLLAPLDVLHGGHEASEKIVWSDSLLEQFKAAQSALSQARTITLPTPDDQLWIVTDGSVKRYGLGATLYITRADNLLLAGFFSAKLRGRQPSWLPCEIEALSIAVATKHFSPYITESKHKACILTDSKPCVQAYEKLCRGEFSTSPRVSTFLSTVSRYQASIRHLAGTSNLPSDFASRNAPDCDTPSCQICSFTERTETCTVHKLSIHDIVHGQKRLPFTSRPAWLATQAECPDLRRTHAHLLQGTRPSKKQTNVKDVKRYLQNASIAKDGLLVVSNVEPFSSSRDRIIVPRSVIDGLLTALHLQLDHPSPHQLRQVTHRYFHALDMDKAVDAVSRGCHQCCAILKIPKTLSRQSTNDSVCSVGISFAADVIKRERQLIFVVRETVTSLTVARLIDNERHDTLRQALLELCLPLVPLDGPASVVRVDPAPGFLSLRSDESLLRHNLVLEIGRPKNVNKNPIAERAIQELELELLRQDPTPSSITTLSLTLAVCRLNTRIRSRGLSAREMWTQRDQFTNDQIHLSDLSLISTQHEQRLANHPHSEVSKCPNRRLPPCARISVGDVVYLHSDGHKNRSRSRYLVVTVDHPWCNVRKFTMSQFRSSSYRVKLEDCYKVPDQSPQVAQYPDNGDPGDESNDMASIPSPPALPDVPETLSFPPSEPWTMNSQCVPQVDIPDMGDSAASTCHPITSPPTDCPTTCPPTDCPSTDCPTRDFPDNVRRSTRQRRRPAKYDDYSVEF
jgi:hypothetical protein